MNEAGVWSYLKNGMKNTGWLPTRLENSVAKGVPDVHYTIPGAHGFIEFKYIPEYPKRPTTPLKLPLRAEQKLWIKTRGEMAGDVWVFVRVEDDFYLLQSFVALRLCEGWDTIQWKRIPHWHKRVDWLQLREMLKEGGGGDE